MEEPERASIWTSGLWALIAAIVMLGWVVWRNVAEDNADGAAYQDVLDARSPAEQTAVETLFSQAYSVLRSPEFRQNLLALKATYPVIYARPGDQDATVEDIASIIGLERPGARYARVAVRLVGDERTRDPEDIHASAGEGQGYGRYADMTFGRGLLNQFRSGDLVNRSCAINAAAHEYAHTITLTPIGYSIAFTDTTLGERRIARRDHPGSPIASYVIGAVAQCTWLQQQGRIDRESVPACVEVFGVGIFNWDRCGKFAGGEPVAPRLDLPRAGDPL